MLNWALGTAVSYGLAALLSLGLKEVRITERKRTGAVRKFIRLMGETVKDRRFLLLLLVIALYGETVQAVTVWLNQNQYLLCGMSSRGIGWTYMAVTVASMAGVFSKRVTDKMGRARSAVIVFCLTALGCAAMAFTRSAALSVGCILIVGLGRGLIGPLFSQVCNQRVTTADRATQLSIFAVISDTAAAGATLAYGQSADVSLPGAFLLGTVICALGAAGLIFSRRYFEEKTAQ